MLEGKEVDVKFDGEAGSAFLDVDAQGLVKAGVSYNKDLDLNGFAKVATKNEVALETNVFIILEKLAAKTETKWDDSAVALIENLFGIKKPV